MALRKRRHLLLGVAVIVCVARSAAGQPFEWKPGFGYPDGNGLDHVAQAFAVFDDGTGPALYAGGAFTMAGSVPVSGIAKWDGAAWSPVGGGVNGDVLALTVFDDGTGPALYAAGAFTTAGEVAANSIAKWDGSTWSALGDGVTPDVYALAVFDDGAGPALYAGGTLLFAGGVRVTNIAKWDGAVWTPLGVGIFPGGLNNTVRSLTVFDDGTGPALYAGGRFTQACDVACFPANSVAKWDGTTWAALGSGTNGAIAALAVFDDGHGPALYAGGVFTTAGGSAASNMARWDGVGWTPLGSGVLGGSDVVQALAVFDDGSGGALYAGGAMYSAGGVTALGIAKWDGTSWSDLDLGLNSDVDALAVFDDGTGPALFAGGIFYATLSGVPSWHIAKWGAVAP